MRHLILLMGVMGAGKSTWLKKNGLNDYTLSSDMIRLMFQSPILTEEGSYIISGKNDHKVWKMLFDLLEKRMERGEFTIIDATHVKKESISAYRKLAQKYRYRVSVVDFSNVPLDVLLQQNQSRPEYKRVPDYVVEGSYHRLMSENVPGWVNVISPEDFFEAIKFHPIDFSHWKKIHHIGDIHGCYTALMKYLGEELKKDELYIFVGDYLDRGIENDKVLRFMLKIKDDPNVILLEGNHEKHIRNWAHEEACLSKEFENYTMPQLEIANFDKKEVRQLYRKFRQLAYYTYGEKTVLVTHGGISKIPENLSLLSTRQLIQGVGDYAIDIDYQWENHTNGDENLIQIHGHRNIFHLPIQAAKNSFNLEGQVEKGNCLRVVTLSQEGFETYKIKNDVFKPSQDSQVVIDAADLTENNFIEYLQNHAFIQEKRLGGNLSSFNFTSKAFKDRVWDDINMKARGLFINTNTKEIVSRSYDKFFNINERFSTKIPTLAKRLKFPVFLYEKPNGYLGTVGYDSESDTLLFTSKSEIKSEHAQWFKEQFQQTFHQAQISFIKDFMMKENVSLIFEVILPKKDPHIMMYPENQLILLDIVYREITYRKKDYETLLSFSKEIGATCKKRLYTYHHWADLYQHYREFINDWGIEAEGYVIEDCTGFMTKVKLPYYNFWKRIRAMKHKFHPMYEPIIQSETYDFTLHNQFFAWANEQDSAYLRDTDIITIRNQFYQDMQF